ncbi:MAG: MFS transporter [Candidatus Lokiarchaeota archaeon]|nr:MFS transporter [Candidatus Lokiarchaeota archaeon]
MEQKTMEIKHSKKSMISYGFGKYISEFFNMCFGAYVFFFYERVIGLNVWYTSAGYIIFAIWNAFNDPLVGYLTDRPFKFTKRWGRRFPWVLIGGIPWILSYLLIFSPPTINPVDGAWILFLWIVVMTCLYDTFASIFGVNFYALFPDKFRDDSERRTASILSTLIGALGTASGAIIPSLFIVWEQRGTYIVQAGVVVIICMVALALAIPGSREDRERIDCYLEKCEEGMERKSFFKEFGGILKNKNFMAYIISFMFYQSLVAIMIGSIPYIAEGVLGVVAEDVTLIMAFLLIGMFVSMPIWGKIADKTNNDRRTMIIAATVLTIGTFPLMFISNYYIMIIAIFIWGFCEGGYWVMLGPVFSIAIDESVVLTGRRIEGTYQGFQTFVSRAALVIQALTFSIVHTLTGFKAPTAPNQPLPPQTELAKFGIQIHFALIPAILMLIATIILWRYFKITPDVVKANKEKIAELGL